MIIRRSGACQPFFSLSLRTRRTQRRMRAAPHGTLEDLRHLGLICVSELTRPVHPLHYRQYP